MGALSFQGYGSDTTGQTSACHETGLYKLYTLYDHFTLLIWYMKLTL